MYSGQASSSTKKVTSSTKEVKRVTIQEPSRKQQQQQQQQEQQQQQQDQQEQEQEQQEQEQQQQQQQQQQQDHHEHPPPPALPKKTKIMFSPSRHVFNADAQEKADKEEFIPVKEKARMIARQQQDYIEREEVTRAKGKVQLSKY
jgi:hypothetical protein